MWCGSCKDAGKLQVYTTESAYRFAHCTCFRGVHIAEVARAGRRRREKLKRKRQKKGKWTPPRVKAAPAPAPAPARVPKKVREQDKPGYAAWAAKQRQCGSKKVYEYKQDAEHQAAFFGQRVYRCNICELFHLSSQQKRLGRG